MKKLIVGKEPEDCRIYCECGSKYRGCDHWYYIENGMPDYLRQQGALIAASMGSSSGFQRNKYICPYCNVKNRLEDTSVKYTKRQLLGFAKMVYVEVDEKAPIGEIKRAIESALQ